LSLIVLITNSQFIQIYSAQISVYEEDTKLTVTMRHIAVKIPRQFMTSVFTNALFCFLFPFLPDKSTVIGISPIRKAYPAEIHNPN